MNARRSSTLARVTDGSSIWPASEVPRKRRQTASKACGSSGVSGGRRGADHWLAQRRVHALAALFELAQHLGGRAEHAIGRQTFGQVRGDLLHFGVGFFAQQQRARLQQQQLAADDEKVGEQVGVDRRLSVHLGQVLVGYLGQADLGDRQATLLDQQQQQLERTVEAFEVQLELGCPATARLHRWPRVSAR